MFWADQITDEITKRFVGPTRSNKPILIRDEKTVSGRVHIGSMRGVAIHGAVSETLTEKNIPNEFKWEFNDFDVFDDVPSNVSHEKFEPYLGMLLKNVPSPDSSAKSFAEYVANDFKSVILETGFNPTFYWGSELYESGKMDTTIQEALEGAEDIRRIYREVSGSQKQDVWLPLSPICPSCKKLATTEASDFDGKTVMVHCRVNKVPYTNGCGFEGRVSPFGGSAKLPWKVEWAAKWKVIRVDVEGGGKDHSTKGGARDVANHISREVFNYEPPFDMPYEFLLVGGKKMSSSKGRGSSAREIADLMPPKILRLALLGKEINQQFNFDPEGDTIPVLYDHYDKLAQQYWAGVKDDYARLFEFIHPEESPEKKSSAAPRLSSRGIPPADTFLPRFSQIAFIAQMPHLNFFQEVERLKGSALTETDQAEAKERAMYAMLWINQYAPEKYVFKLQEELPDATRVLTSDQKTALATLRQFIAKNESMPSGEELHHELHVIKEGQKIAPGDLFGAIYLAFLGKPYGPKAGWFLSVLPKEFVLKRLVETSS
jgi:lysyl-tRNA synthetase class 1